MEYMTITEVSKKIGVKKRTILEWVRNGQFPKPDKTKNHKSRWWKEETIDEWMDDEN